MGMEACGGSRTEVDLSGDTSRSYPNECGMPWNAVDAHKALSRRGTDLLAGQVQVAFDTMTTSIEHIRAGRLRALAVTSATRAQALPDLPTVADYLPGFESSSWQGVGAPAHTPPKLVARLNAEINAALADAAVKARFETLGGTPMPMTAAAFGKLIADETEKWAKVVKFANIRAE
jgi:tripartite-type tricarboxylate transporter receptor subunit TctC